ncbi:MAG: sigma-54 dependent transcriptional regulator, partial [Bdellovibrionota bacterium]
MKKLLGMADNVATSRAAILIQGESGTGKELLARYIHTKSSRSSGTFVALNCAAVPEGLLESELFGHEKGSFTGAHQTKIGKFEMAHQGTFLLDEISELPLHLQTKILRVIQEGEVERVGGSKPIKVDVRLISASNKLLSEQVKKGLFRDDLFYRLNVIPLEIPPLRARPNDITLLAELFNEVSCKQNGLANKKLSPDSLKKLLNWRWPGNVRELQNVIERAVLLSPALIIEPADLHIENFADLRSDRDSLSVGMTVEEAEKRLIMKTLEYTHDNRTQAATLLGISIRTLRNKLNEYKLEVADEQRTI